MRPPDAVHSHASLEMIDECDPSSVLRVNGEVARSYTRVVAMRKRMEDTTRNRMISMSVAVRG